MSGGLHRGATIVLSSIVGAIGLVLVGVTLAQGGGPLAKGVLVGILFTLAGAGRAYIAWRGTDAR